MFFHHIGLSVIYIKSPYISQRYDSTCLLIVGSGFPLTQAPSISPIIVHHSDETTLANISFPAPGVLASANANICTAHF
jgi:hypothetical protein